MRRALLCLVLLAGVAAAEKVAVRVVIGNEPVPDAGVKAIGKDEGAVFDSLAWAPDARTDAAGQAVVDVKPGGRILVYVPGYALAVVPGGGTMVDVALLPERIFQGRLLDRKGNPVTGADVYLRTTFLRRATLQARSDGKGRFFVYGLWLDDYEIAAEAEGFVPQRTGTLTEDDSGDTLVLDRYATLAGKVSDGEGRPLAGVEVVANGSPQKTGADGRYRFARLEPGVYAVALAPPRGGDAPPVTLADGETRDGVDLVALAPATLRVRVVDEAQEPLAGVSVGASVSDKGGRVVVRVPPGRREVLRVTAEDRVPQSVAYGPEEAGGTRDLGDVVLLAFPMVEVRVRAPDGTIPKEGKVGATKLVEGVARVRAGIHDLAVPGFAVQSRIIEPPGPVELTLPGPHWLTGTVVDTEGAPVGGASVLSAQYRLDVTTDAEGRFRLGPFPEADARVQAQTATASSPVYDVPLGEGELEITLRQRSPELLRGRVLRGVAPVRRFEVEATAFLDEDGRFELLVERASLRFVRIKVGERSFPFALPPPGDELIARLPASTVNVTPAGAVPGLMIVLKGAGGAEITKQRTDPDGVARFVDLEPGIHTAAAVGFAPAEFTVAADGVTPLVTLGPVGWGTLRLGAVVRRMGPGVHRDVYREYGRSLDAVRIEAGVETVVDFHPANGGSLLVRGPAGTSVWLTLRTVDATMTYREAVAASGELRFLRLPPGAYELRTPAELRTVEVEAGESAVVDLGTGSLVVAGQVRLPSGKPAQGAGVQLVPEGAESGRRARTGLDGRFRFADVAPGEYDCVVELEGHASGTVPVTVAEDGVVADGLPLTLQKAAGARAQLQDPTGAPLAGAAVRVDGRWTETDALGWVDLDRVPASLDLDLEGYASIRDRAVRDGQVVRLVRGATLIVRADDVSELRVLVGGEEWRRLRSGGLLDEREPGVLRLDDLPPGPVLIEQPAPEPEEGAEEEPEPPEPVRATLRPGAVTTVDLREG